MGKLPTGTHLRSRVWRTVSTLHCYAPGPEELWGNVRTLVLLVGSRGFFPLLRVALRLPIILKPNKKVDTKAPIKMWQKMSTWEIRLNFLTFFATFYWSWAPTVVWDSLHCPPSQQENLPLFLYTSPCIAGLLSPPGPSRKSNQMYVVFLWCKIMSLKTNMPQRKHRMYPLKNQKRRE